MNLKRETCVCGKELLRISAQSHFGKISLGFYCIDCKIMFGLDGYPLISYKAVFHIEPEPRLGIIRDLFPIHWPKVLLKLQGDPNVRTLPNEIRYPQNAIEIQVRKDEMMEANKNQETSIK